MPVASSTNPIKVPLHALPGAATQTAPSSGTKMIEGRISTILRGEKIETTVHPQLQKEEIVLNIDDFNLWYGPKQALHHITLGIPRGKITALIGPSGCGKSTLLRSVNRLNDLIDSVRIDGDMRLNGDSVFHRSVDVIELRKRMGMVFQKPNPFPMSI